MSNLDWEECEESGQATAQGNGVTYWIVESNDSCSLWVKPDTIDDGFTEWKGSAACCMQHADLIEANKQIADWDRILRASVSEDNKNCTSPIGAVQSELGQLERMLGIAWSAINEAGYEGYSNELKEYMEND